MVVMFDQGKFFDRIEANLLLRKMKDYAIPKNIIVQVRHILTKRTMRVKVNHEYSEARKLCNGSPQGLSLSLPLSAIYTNGLKKFQGKRIKEMSLEGKVEVK